MTKCNLDEVELIDGEMCHNRCGILCDLLAAAGQWHRLNLADIVDECEDVPPTIDDATQYLVDQADEVDVLVWTRELPDQPDGDFFARAMYR
jgi:hypothetical protein